MNFRTTAILLAIVILAVGGLLIVTQWEDAPATDGGLLGSFATGIKPADVDTLELSRTEPGEGKLVFVRTGPNQWELRQPQNARVDSAAVDAVVKSIWDAKPTKHPGLTTDPGKHGLAKPAFTATLKSKGERSLAVNVGDTTLGGSDAVTFLTTGDRPTVPLAVRTSDLKPLFRDNQSGKEGSAAAKAKWLADYRSKRLLNADTQNPGGDLASFQLTRGPQTIRLAHGSDGTWKFEQPANFGEADILGDSNPKAEFFTGVRPLLNLLVNLQASSPDDFLDNVPESEWPKYGLAANDPTVIRAELKPKGDAPAEVVFLGKAVEGATPTRIYCRRENEPGIVKVPFDRLATIAGTLEHPGELRNRDYLAENRKDLIDAFDITVKGEAFRLRKLPSGWKVYGGTEPRDVNPGAIQALIEALCKPRAATTILDAPNPSAFAPAEIQGDVKVWFAGVPKAAPRDTAEPKLKGDADAAFAIGKVDTEGSFFQRTMNGTVTQYKIGADLVAALTKRRLEFIAVKIDAFTPFNATSLTLTRGAATVEVKKTTAIANPDMRWAFVQPVANKDQSADSFTISKLLQSIGTVQPRKIVSESPTADELKKWGLEPAKAVVSVGLSGTEKPRGFLIGSETEDKTSVYLKLTELPFVILAPKVLLEELLAADFRDKVIFYTDPAKVVKIVLNGWKTATTPAKRVVLEKKGGAWVSDVPDFVPDDAKVKVFLDQLRAPRLTDFVTEVKPAEMGLSAENGSLQVFLYQEGVAEPVWIDLGGKEEPSKQEMFATSSGVKNMVFKIDGTYFQQFVTNIKALQK